MKRATNEFSWKLLLQSALLELDEARLLQLVNAAEQKISEQIERCRRNSGDDCELERLLAALTDLHDLRKMAAALGPSRRIC